MEVLGTLDRDVFMRGATFTNGRFYILEALGSESCRIFVVTLSGQLEDTWNIPLFGDSIGTFDENRVALNTGRDVYLIENGQPELLFEASSLGVPFWKDGAMWGISYGCDLRRYSKSGESMLRIPVADFVAGLEEATDCDDITSLQFHEAHWWWTQKEGTYDPDKWSIVAFDPSSGALNVFAAFTPDPMAIHWEGDSVFMVDGAWRQIVRVHLDRAGPQSWRSYW